MFNGAVAAGSLGWGLVAHAIGVPGTLLAGATGLVLAGLLMHRLKLPAGEADLQPTNHWPEPSVAEPGAWSIYWASAGQNSSTRQVPAEKTYPHLFRPIRVLARRHEPLVAAGVHAALASAPGIERVTARDDAPLLEVEVLTCDYESGMAWVQHQRLRAVPARRVPGVIVVKWRDSEEDVRAAVKAGIGGYLLGDCDLGELVDAVRFVDRGSPT